MYPIPHKTENIPSRYKYVGREPLSSMQCGGEVQLNIA